MTFTFPRYLDKKFGLILIVFGFAIDAGPAQGQTISFFRQITAPEIDAATSVAVDGSGIYVAGYKLTGQNGQGRAGIRKYDPAGNELWDRELTAGDGNSLRPLKVLAATSSVYVLLQLVDAAGLWSTRILRRYSSGGEELWTLPLDRFGAVASDSTGVYVSGKGSSNSGYLRKYNSDGAELWHTQWGDANGSFYPAAVTADLTGVYVFGLEMQGQFVRKYDLGGRELWMRTLSRYYESTFAAANPSGFYVATLEFAGTVSLRRYNSSGDELWSRRIATWNDSGWSGPPDVVADGTAVYVASGNNQSSGLPGYCRSGSGGDSFVRKYSPEGAELWTRQFGTAEGSSAFGVAVNDTGVFVVGQVGVARFDLFEPAGIPRAAYLAKFEKNAATRDASTPHIFPDCVVNAASYVGGGVAPGEIVTIIGEGIGPAEPAPLQLTGEGRVSTSLANVRILFDGVAAPLLYVSSIQSTAIVPYAVSGKDFVEVLVEYGGARSEALRVPVLASRPGIFSLGASGRGPGAVLNEDRTVNSPSNPARWGSIISFFGTGGGEVDSALIDGQIVDGVPPKVHLPVSVFIGQQPAEVLYAGGVRGSVAGLLQVDARLPTNRGPTVAVDYASITLMIGLQWTGLEVWFAVR